MTNHRDIIAKYRYKLLDLKHVKGVGFGIKEKNGKKTGDESIIVLVDHKVSFKMLNKSDYIPESIEGYKTDVQEIGDIQLLNERTERFRPVQPGISIGHYKVTAGTLGAIVKDKKTGNPLILSNNHVLANITNGSDGRSKIGDPILQPGVYDQGSRPDDVVAHLERFIPIMSNHDNPENSLEEELQKVEDLSNELLHLYRPDYNFKLSKQPTENKVDCAVAKPVNEDIVDPKIIDIGKIKGAKEAEIEMKIRKSGRTTGLTNGNIKAINTSVEVNMSRTEVALFEDQIITDSISKGGDSGSLIVDEDNNAVGLLFAGSDQATICNNILNVLEKLEIEF